MRSLVPALLLLIYVKQLRLEVKDGFIDLKQVLKDQGKEIIQRIDQVAQDVEFKHHRTILVQAYGLFATAIKRFQLALALQDANTRNSEINASRDMLFKALADYDNSHLLEGLVLRDICVDKNVFGQLSKQLSQLFRYRVSMGQ
jgi:hypothetical protein